MKQISMLKTCTYEVLTDFLVNPEKYLNLTYVNIRIVPGKFVIIFIIKLKMIK